MRCLKVALVGRKGDVSVIDWLEEVESIWVALESVERKHVSSVNSVSQELQSHGGGWSQVFSHGGDFRDTKNTVFGSSQ